MSAMNNQILAEGDIGGLIWIIFVVGMVIFSSIAEKLKKKQTEQKRKENYRRANTDINPNVSSNIPNAGDSDRGSVEDLMSAVRRASKQRQQQSQSQSSRPRHASQHSDAARARMGENTPSSDRDIEKLRSRRQQNQQDSGEQDLYEKRRQQLKREKQAAQQRRRQKLEQKRRQEKIDQQKQQELQRQSRFADISQQSSGSNNEMKQLLDAPVAAKTESIRSTAQIDPLNPDLSDPNTARAAIILTEIFNRRF